VVKSSCTPLVSAQIVFISRTGAGSPGNTHEGVELVTQRDYHGYECL